MAEFVRIAKIDEVEEGKGMVVEAGEKCLAVFKVDGAFHVIDNTCLHRGGPLGEGDVEGETVTCPWHGWEYNVKTGHCVNNPSSHVRSYPTVIENGEVKVDLSSP
jgi:3-phenylpropionate/trans-cinnamate dioxygenase ferredoxin component